MFKLNNNVTIIKKFNLLKIQLELINLVKSEKFFSSLRTGEFVSVSNTDLDNTINEILCFQFESINETVPNQPFSRDIGFGPYKTALNNLMNNSSDELFELVISNYIAKVCKDLLIKDKEIKFMFMNVKDRNNDFIKRRINKINEKILDLNNSDLQNACNPIKASNLVSKLKTSKGLKNIKSVFMGDNYIAFNKLDNAKIKEIPIISCNKKYNIMKYDDKMKVIKESKNIDDIKDKYNKYLSINECIKLGEGVNYEDVMVYSESCKFRDQNHDFNYVVNNTMEDYIDSQINYNHNTLILIKFDGSYYVDKYIINMEEDCINFIDIYEGELLPTKNYSNNTIVDMIENDFVQSKGKILESYVICSEEVLKRERITVRKDLLEPTIKDNNMTFLEPLIDLGENYFNASVNCNNSRHHHKIERNDNDNNDINIYNYYMATGLGNEEEINRLEDLLDMNGNEVDVEHNKCCFDILNLDIQSYCIYLEYMCKNINEFREDCIIGMINNMMKIVNENYDYLIVESENDVQLFCSLIMRLRHEFCFHLYTLHLKITEAHDINNVVSDMRVDEVVDCDHENFCKLTPDLMIKEDDVLYIYEIGVSNRSEEYTMKKEETYKKLIEHLRTDHGCNIVYKVIIFDPLGEIVHGDDDDRLQSAFKSRCHSWRQITSNWNKSFPDIASNIYNPVRRKYDCKNKDYIRMLETNVTTNTEDTYFSFEHCNELIIKIKQEINSIKDMLRNTNLDYVEISYDDAESKITCNSSSTGLEMNHRRRLGMVVKNKNFRMLAEIVTMNSSIKSKNLSSFMMPLIRNLTDTKLHSHTSLYAHVSTEGHTYRRKCDMKYEEISYNNFPKFDPVKNLIDVRKELDKVVVFVENILEDQNNLRDINILYSTNDHHDINDFNKYTDIIKVENKPAYFKKTFNFPIPFINDFSSFENPFKNNYKLEKVMKSQHGETFNIIMSEINENRGKINYEVGKLPTDDHTKKLMRRSIMNRLYKQGKDIMCKHYFHYLTKDNGYNNKSHEIIDYTQLKSAFSKEFNNLDVDKIMDNFEPTSTLLDLLKNTYNKICMKNVLFTRKANHGIKYIKDVYHCTDLYKNCCEKIRIDFHTKKEGDMSSIYNSMGPAKILSLFEEELSTWLSPVTTEDIDILPDELLYAIGKDYPAFETVKSKFMENFRKFMNIFKKTKLYRICIFYNNLGKHLSILNKNKMVKNQVYISEIMKGIYLLAVGGKNMNDDHGYIYKLIYNNTEEWDRMLGVQPKISLLLRGDYSETHFYSDTITCIEYYTTLSTNIIINIYLQYAMNDYNMNQSCINMYPILFALNQRRFNEEKLHQHKNLFNHCGFFQSDFNYAIKNCIPAKKDLVSLLIVSSLKMNLKTYYEFYHSLGVNSTANIRNKKLYPILFSDKYSMVNNKLLWLNMQPNSLMIKADIDVKLETKNNVYSILDDQVDFYNAYNEYPSINGEKYRSITECNSLDHNEIINNKKLGRFNNYNPNVCALLGKMTRDYYQTHPNWREIRKRIMDVRNTDQLDIMNTHGGKLSEVIPYDNKFDNSIMLIELKEFVDCFYELRKLYKRSNNKWEKFKRVFDSMSISFNNIKLTDDDILNAVIEKYNKFCDNYRDKLTRNLTSGVNVIMNVQDLLDDEVYMSLLKEQKEALLDDEDVRAYNKSSRKIGDYSQKRYDEMNCPMVLHIASKIQRGGGREIYTPDTYTNTQYKNIEKIFDILSNEMPHEFTTIASDIQSDAKHRKMQENDRLQLDDSSIFLKDTIDNSKWGPGSNLYKYIYFIIGMSDLFPRDIYERMIDILINLADNKFICVNPEVSRIVIRDHRFLNYKDYCFVANGKLYTKQCFSWMMGMLNKMSSLMHATSQILYSYIINVSIVKHVNEVNENDELIKTVLHTDSGELHYKVGNKRRTDDNVVDFNNYKKRIKGCNPYEIDMTESYMAPSLMDASAHSDDAYRITCVKKYFKPRIFAITYELFQLLCNHTCSEKKSGTSLNSVEYLSTIYIGNTLIPPTSKFCTMPVLFNSVSGYTTDISAGISVALNAFRHGLSEEVTYLFMRLMLLNIYQKYEVDLYEIVSNDLFNKVRESFGLPDCLPMMYLVRGTSADYDRISIYNKESFMSSHYINTLFKGLSGEEAGENDEEINLIPKVSIHKSIYLQSMQKIRDLKTNFTERLGITEEQFRLMSSLRFLRMTDLSSKFLKLFNVIKTFENKSMKVATARVKDIFKLRNFHYNSTIKNINVSDGVMISQRDYMKLHLIVEMLMKSFNEGNLLQFKEIDDGIVLENSGEGNSNVEIMESFFDSVQGILKSKNISTKTIVNVNTSNVFQNSQVFYDVPKSGYTIRLLLCIVQEFVDLNEIIFDSKNFIKEFNELNEKIFPWIDNFSKMMQSFVDVTPKSYDISTKNHKIVKPINCRIGMTRHDFIKEVVLNLQSDLYTLDNESSDLARSLCRLTNSSIIHDAERLGSAYRHDSYGFETINIHQFYKVIKKDVRKFMMIINKHDKRNVANVEELIDMTRSSRYETRIDNFNTQDLNLLSSSTSLNRVSNVQYYKDIKKLFNAIYDYNYSHEIVVPYKNNNYNLSIKNHLNNFSLTVIADLKKIKMMSSDLFIRCICDNLLTVMNVNCRIVENMCFSYWQKPQKNNGTGFFGEGVLVINLMGYRAVVKIFDVTVRAIDIYTIEGVDINNLWIIVKSCMYKLGLTINQDDIVAASGKTKGDVIGYLSITDQQSDIVSMGSQHTMIKFYKCVKIFKKSSELSREISSNIFDVACTPHLNLKLVKGNITVQLNLLGNLMKDNDYESDLLRCNDINNINFKKLLNLRGVITLRKYDLLMSIAERGPDELHQFLEIFQEPLNLQKLSSSEDFKDIIDNLNKRKLPNPIKAVLTLMQFDNSLFTFGAEKLSELLETTGSMSIVDEILDNSDNKESLEIIVIKMLNKFTSVEILSSLSLLDNTLVSVINRMVDGLSLKYVINSARSIPLDVIFFDMSFMNNNHNDWDLVNYYNDLMKCQDTMKLSAFGSNNDTHRILDIMPNSLNTKLLELYKNYSKDGSHLRRWTQNSADYMQSSELHNYIVQLIRDKDLEKLNANISAINVLRIIKLNTLMNNGNQPSHHDEYKTKIVTLFGYKNKVYSAMKQHRFFENLLLMVKNLQISAKKLYVCGDINNAKIYEHLISYNYITKYFNKRLEYNREFNDNKFTIITGAKGDIPELSAIIKEYGFYLNKYNSIDTSSKEYIRNKAMMIKKNQVMKNDDKYVREILNQVEFNKRKFEIYLKNNEKTLHMNKCYYFWLPGDSMVEHESLRIEDYETMYFVDCLQGNDMYMDRLNKLHRQNHGNYVTMEDLGELGEDEEFVEDSDDVKFYKMVDVLIGELDYDSVSNNKEALVEYNKLIHHYPDFFRTKNVSFDKWVDDSLKIDFCSYEYDDNLFESLIRYSRSKLSFSDAKKISEFVPDLIEMLIQSRSDNYFENNMTGQYSMDNFDLITMLIHCFNHSNSVICIRDKPIFYATNTTIEFNNKWGMKYTNKLIVNKNVQFISKPIDFLKLMTIHSKIDESMKEMDINKDIGVKDLLKIYCNLKNNEVDIDILMNQHIDIYKKSVLDIMYNLKEDLINDKSIRSNKFLRLFSDEGYLDQAIEDIHESGTFKKTNRSIRKNTGKNILDDTEFVASVHKIVEDRLNGITNLEDKKIASINKFNEPQTPFENLINPDLIQKLFMKGQRISRQDFNSIEMQKTSLHSLCKEAYNIDDFIGQFDETDLIMPSANSKKKEFKEEIIKNDLSLTIQNQIDAIKGVVNLLNTIQDNCIIDDGMNNEYITNTLFHSINQTHVTTMTYYDELRESLMLFKDEPIKHRQTKKKFCKSEYY